MPIDPSIPLQARVPQSPSLGDLMGQVLQIQNMRDDREARQLQQQESAAIKQEIANAGGDLEKAIPGVTRVSPSTGLALGKQVKESQAADLNLKKLRLEHDRLVLSTIADSFAAVADDDQAGWDAALERLRANEIPVDKISPRVDNNMRDYYVRQALGAKEVAEQRAKALEAKAKANEPKVVGDALVKPDGTVVYQGDKKETRSLAQQANDANKNGDTAEYQRLLKVIKETGQADDRPNQSSSGMGAQFGGDFNKTGEEFLATIPLQWRRTVRAIGSYDVDPNRSVQARGGDRQKVMAWALQYNPSYDSSVFANRAPTRKAYTTGTQGQQITALNTAIGHLGQMEPIIARLNNSSFVPGNRVWNDLREMFGSDKPTNFETLKNSLAAEVDSILSKGQATVSGRKEQSEAINTANSPEQLAGYLKTLIPLLGSRLAGLDYAYHQAMGADDPFQALSPASQKVLEKYGFDESMHDGGTKTPGFDHADPPATGGAGATAAPVPDNVSAGLKDMPPNTYTIQREGQYKGKKVIKRADGIVVWAPGNP